MSVVVVATITPKPGALEEVEEAFAETIAKVHGEPGCELYALHRNRSDGTLVMIEKWTDADSLAAHSKGAALTELGGKLAELTEGRGDVRLLDPAPYGDGAKGIL